MKDREKLFFVLSIIFKPHIAFCIMCGLGYNIKQLHYYLFKWEDKGFYDYEELIYSGWIIFSKLTGEYDRIFRMIKYWSYDRTLKNSNQILTDPEEVNFNDKILIPYKKYIIEKYMESFKND